MAKKELWELARKQDIVRVAKGLGLGILREQPNGNLRGPSISGGGEGAFCIYPEDNSWYDFKAQKGGSVIDLLAEVKYGGDAIKALYELIPPEKAAELVPEIREQQTLETEIKEWHNALMSGNSLAEEALAYLHGRGISDETIVGKNLGLRLTGGAKRVVVPFMDERGNVVTWSARAIDKDVEPRWYNRPNTSLSLFGWETIAKTESGNEPITPEYIPPATLPEDTDMGASDALVIPKRPIIEGIPRSKILVICEGIFDAMNFHMKSTAALATGGSRGIKGHEYNVIEGLLNKEAGNRFSHIVLAFDNDENGRKYTVSTLTKLLTRRVPNVLIAGIPDNFKDVGEFCEAGNNVDDLLISAYDGLRFIARYLCGSSPFPELLPSEQDGVKARIRDFILLHGRWMSPDSLQNLKTLLIESMGIDVSPISGKLKDKEILKWLDTIIQQATRARSEVEIVNEAIKKHELIFSEPTGFYEYSKARGIWEARADSEIGSYAKRIIGLPAKNGFINAVVGHLKKTPGVCSRIPIDKFNKQHKIVFANGVLDISNGKFDTDFSKEHYCTMALDYTYDETAKCPAWERFLKTTLSDPSIIAQPDITSPDGDKLARDEEGWARAQLLQEFAGYTLWPENTLQRALALVGEGSNGKSIFLNTLIEVFGADNVSHVGIAEMGQDFHLIPLKDKMLNVASDEATNFRGGEAVFKRLVAGDVVTDSLKGKDRIDFLPRAKLWMSFNRLPKARDASYGFLRRFLFVEFPNRFGINPTRPDELKADPGLARKLKEELPGIFNWAFAGYRRLMAQGHFTEGPDQARLTEEFGAMANPLRAFVAETIIGKSGQFKRVEIYEDYKKSRYRDNAVK